MEASMHSRRLASTLVIAAALAMLAGAAGGAWSRDARCFYKEVVRAIEPSLPLGDPYG
jgi:hypothetical protein